MTISLPYLHTGRCLLADAVLQSGQDLQDLLGVERRGACCRQMMPLEQFHDALGGIRFHECLIGIVFRASRFITEQYLNQR